MSSARITRELNERKRSPTRGKHQQGSQALLMTIYDRWMQLEKSVRRYFHPRPAPTWQYTGDLNDIRIVERIVRELPWLSVMYFTATNKKNRAYLNFRYPEFNAYRLARHEQHARLLTAKNQIDQATKIMIDLFMVMPAFAWMAAVSVGVKWKVEETQYKHLSGLFFGLMLGLILVGMAFLPDGRNKIAAMFLKNELNNEQSKDQQIQYYKSLKEKAEVLALLRVDFKTQRAADESINALVGKLDNDIAEKLTSPAAIRNRAAI